MSVSALHVEYGDPALDTDLTIVNGSPMIIRRLGPDPHANGAQTSSLDGCPDILELEDGDFAVIGVDITESAAGKLAFGASCGRGERIVRIPRKTLVLARPDIPSQV